YGTPLGAAQLDATVAVAGPAPAGTLSYTPAAGSILDAGPGQVLTVVAAATQDYRQATATVPLDVLKATPVLTWPAPASIFYGTPLGPAQLDAAASVAGTFAYTPAAGIVLDAGPGQTLAATFTPADPADFLPVTVNARINVAPAPLVIAVDDAATTY